MTSLTGTKLGTLRSMYHSHSNSQVRQKANSKYGTQNVCCSINHSLQIDLLTLIKRNNGQNYKNKTQNQNYPFSHDDLMDAVLQGLYFKKRTFTWNGHIVKVRCPLSLFTKSTWPTGTLDLVLLFMSKSDSHGPNMALWG